MKTTTQSFSTDDATTTTDQSFAGQMQARLFLILSVTPQGGSLLTLFPCATVLAKAEITVFSQQLVSGSFGKVNQVCMRNVNEDRRKERN